jgi:hypothetical protein
VQLEVTIQLPEKGTTQGITCGLTVSFTGIPAKLKFTPIEKEAIITKTKR